MTNAEAASPPHEIERELCGPLPRRVRESSRQVKRRRVTANLAGCLLCFACYLASTNLRNENDWLRSERHIDCLIRTKQNSSSGDTPHYFLQGAFVGAPSSDTEPIEVNFEEYSEAKEGDPVRLYYLGSDLTGFRLTPVTQADVDALRESWYVGVAAVVVCGVGAFSLWVAARRNQLYLLRYGEVAVATMVPQDTLTAEALITGALYRFCDNTGATRCGTALFSKWQYELYANGRPFTVLYNSAKPNRSLPYFRIVKAEWN